MSEQAVLQVLHLVLLLLLFPLDEPRLVDAIDDAAPKLLDVENLTSNGRGRTRSVPVGAEMNNTTSLSALRKELVQSGRQRRHAAPSRDALEETTNRVRRKGVLDPV